MKESRGNRLHIAVLGKMNVGKSSVINAIFGREISIVSDYAGTTTDVNQKAMELVPIGPVSIMDTAGLDDKGELGEKRVEKTMQTLDRADVAIVVFDNNGVKKCDEELFEELKKRKIPILSVVNKIDISHPLQSEIETIKKYSDSIIELSAKEEKNITSKVKQALINILTDEQINSPSLLKDIIQKNDNIILVIPIDKEAPKGRIILPQVQTIRDILDNNAISTICSVENLKQTIENLKTRPRLVITDSQAFREVDKIVDNAIPLTSFSILFAKLKGDLKTFENGANALDGLNNGDKILICENCSHHPVEDDIGRVKIPNLIKKYTNKNLIKKYTNKDIAFEHASGHIFPKDIEKYSLIVHCGACMTNRREVLSRIEKANSKGIPISNYGIIIAKCLGILDRTLEPFKS